MAYKLKKNIAHSSNYGSKRSEKDIEWLVIHFTANDGDTDEANGKYFDGANRNASAHYFVDSDSVTQSVPDNYIAWSVGGSKYSSCKLTGGGNYYGICKNSNSISIEICDDRRNGSIYPSAKTIENAITLTKELMKKYDIDADHVIRHFDVTGKSCPGYWCGTYSKDKKWKSEFHNKLTAKEKFEPYLVKITAKSLMVRKGPGKSNSVVMYVKKDQVYTIVDVHKKDSITWGLLKSGEENRDRWINLSYTKEF